MTKPYELEIDGPLFSEQRFTLWKYIDCVTDSEDRELLEGLQDTLDEIAQQARDRHGIKCLMLDMGMQPHEHSGGPSAVARELLAACRLLLESRFFGIPSQASIAIVEKVVAKALADL